MKKIIRFCSSLFIIPIVTDAQSVGIGTTTPHTASTLHVDIGANISKGVLITGSYNNAATIPDLGQGSRLMFYPGKGAFRAGVISANYATTWDDINVGAVSIGLGYNTLASGLSSTALGYISKATGSYAVAIGSNAEASGDWSLALGSGDATGNYAVALGGSNVASGGASTSMGWQTVAKGYASTVIGYYNDSILATNQTGIQPTTPLFIIGNGANGARSNAMVVLKNGSVGIGTNAPDANALLHVNCGTTSRGFLVSGETGVNNVGVPNLGGGRRMTFFPSKFAFRAGFVNSDEWDDVNVGRGSVAMGAATIASGPFSFAMGELTKATSDQAVAFGWRTQATAFATTAMGATAIASGEVSTAIGNATVARGYASTVIGSFNDPILATPQTSITSTTPLFIIGNGSAGSLSNAMVVLKNGNVGIGTNAPTANLVLNDAANATLQLQEAGVDKGFVQLSGNNLRIGAYSSNSTANVIFRLNGGDRFTIFPTGNATLTGTLTQNSDERLKQNITTIDNALEKVMQLNGYEYYWKRELQKDSALQIGLLAQNVEKVLPALVATDNDGIKSVAYQNIVPVLIEAIKELQLQIKELKARGNK